MVSSVLRSHIMSCAFPPNTDATYSPVSAGLWCDGWAIISKERSSFQVFRRWNMSPAIYAPLFNGAWDQSRRKNISLGCSSLLVSAIDLNPRSSLWKRSVSPYTYQTGWLCLKIRFITWFLSLLRTEGSVWFLNTERRHGAQQYLPAFSWPKQEPVTQIDFVLWWGCVISRGKIMSIVSLMDRECIMGHTF